MGYPKGKGSWVFVQKNRGGEGILGEKSKVECRDSKEEKRTEPSPTTQRATMRLNRPQQASR